MNSSRPIGPMLAALTGAKAIANGANRWVPFFLPTLARAFNASTAQMTTVLGLGEMAGLLTLVAGKHLDRGRERVFTIGAMLLVTVGSLLALTGRLSGFALGYFCLLLATALCTVSGHTYLSRRIPYARRARAIGVFEMSWASALLIGAPLAAALIGWIGWRGPFFYYSITGVVLAIVISRIPDVVAPLDDAGLSTASADRRLTPMAWVAVLASGAIAMGGLTTVAVAGTWLTEVFGVSTGGVGLVAMAFGGAELIASSASAGIADRVGPIRSTRFAIAVTFVGLLAMTQAASLVVAAVALFAFFVGFEYSIVTSFSIVSEAMPKARGKVLVTNAAVGTMLRGIGVTMSGTLYERFGISGPVAVSATAVVAAMALLTWLRAVRESAPTATGVTV